MLQTLNLYISVGMIGEFVTERLFAFAAGNIAIGIYTVFEVAIQSQHISVADDYLLSLVQLAKIEACPTDDALTHIHHPFVALEA